MSRGGGDRWLRDGILPDNPVPKTYPLRFCAPAHRFSVSILVTA